MSTGVGVAWLGGRRNFVERVVSCSSQASVRNDHQQRVPDLLSLSSVHQQRLPAIVRVPLSPKHLTGQGLCSG